MKLTSPMHLLPIEGYVEPSLHALYVVMTWFVFKHRDKYNLMFG